MKPMVGSKTTVLPLQNGVDAVSSIDCGIRPGSWIGGLCRIVSFLVEPGHIRHAGFAPSVVIGELDNRTHGSVVAIEKLSIMLELKRRLLPDIHAALWMKFLFIASFSGVGAIANAPAGILRSNPEYACANAGGDGRNLCARACA